MKVGTRRSGRPAVLAAGVFGAAVVLGALGLVQNGATAPSSSETAAHRFKNIKVLKNMPADQLMPAMRNISESLGVRCDFCHVVNPDHTITYTVGALGNDDFKYRISDTLGRSSVGDIQVTVR